ncbi:hypothetical protein [Roseovarius ramblicola]|uniref:Uncharacterized protein n=1 Tax=Roseovarius ramblicola TaxID=2022336 RepID=A0ABV5HZX1_9RHOB
MHYIPSQITAGVTLDHTVAPAAYPASAGWTLTLYLRGPQSIDIAATADGDDHVLGATATQTGAWLAGQYWATLRASDGETVAEIEAGQVTIATDLAQVDGLYDGRGHAERVLTAIEAVIEGRATKDQERYRINNRELQRTPLADLMGLRDKYRAEVRAQKAARRGQSLLGRTVSVRL